MAAPKPPILLLGTEHNPDLVFRIRMTKKVASRLLEASAEAAGSDATIWRADYTEGLRFEYRHASLLRRFPHGTPTHPGDLPKERARAVRGDLQRVTDPDRSIRWYVVPEGKTAGEMSEPLPFSAVLIAACFVMPKAEVGAVLRELAREDPTLAARMLTSGPRYAGAARKNEQVRDLVPLLKKDDLAELLDSDDADLRSAALRVSARVSGIGPASGSVVR